MRDPAMTSPDANSPRASGPEARANPALASLWFGAALYLNSALLFLATPVFTRLLSTHEYGQVVLYGSWAVVLGMFATLSLSGGVFQAALLEFSRDLDRYLSSMLGLTTVSVLACLAMVLGVMKLSGDFTGLGYGLVLFLFAWLLANATLLFWQGRERFFYRYRLAVGITAPASAIAVAGAIAAILLLPAHRVEARIVAGAFPVLALGLVLYAVLLRRGGAFYSKKYWTYALALNIPLLPHYLSQAFLLQFDRFAIERAAGTTEVGVYGLAAALASAVTLFWTAINASWVPWMMRKLREGRERDIAGRSREFLVAVGAACVMLALVAPEAVAVLAPAAYRGAARVVPLLLLASYLQFAQTIFLTAEFYRKRVLAITLCSVLAVLINVACNLALVPAYGMVAAGFAIVGCQLFQLAFHFAVVRGCDRLRIVGARPLAGISLATAAGVALAMAGQPSVAARWSLCALTAAACAFLAWRRFPLAAVAGGPR
jgi:O-antigen/teichoic acid export membrane protein